ncbi:AbiV family abortive infection protein [Priestia megaterium]|uniref:AbiV family abortive infection protein n=1 Tax=Priestia megaterium TaxID=1404 RepID=UPI0023DC7491|nr:AbiV family abortive infection protein [Priestia megaterium]MDF2015546.1 AbiV family abortive infection protein [Priestia megaterium]
MTALSFGKLEEAYIFVYENVKELLEESRLLYENKKYARSYALAQFAHEELAKLPIIYQEASRAFFKEPHDWKDFHKRLRSHESKNKMNFIFYRYMLDIAKKEHSDFTIEKMEDTLQHINELKNNSIYADIKNNKFTKPSLEIEKNLAGTHLELVEEMFKTFSLSNFHIKGGIKKSLDIDKAKLQKESFRKLGLIK